MAGNMAVTAILAVAMVCTLIWNAVFLLVFIARKRMKKAVNYLLLTMAIVDILGVLFWTSFTALSSALGSWELTNGVCYFQVYFFGFCALVNAHMIMILLLERCLRVFKPSKHAEVFFNTVVLLMIGAIVLFDLVLAMFPLIGWGEITYMSAQYQCGINYIYHETQLDFSFFWQFALPVVVCAVCYTAVLMRLRSVKKETTEGEAVVLEQDYAVKGDAYFDRLQKLNVKFQKAGVKKRKPKIKPSTNSSAGGYKTSSDDSTTDSDSAGIGAKPISSVYSKSAADDTTSPKSQTRKKKLTKKSLFKSEEREGVKKTYVLTKGDTLLVHMYGAMAVLYFSMWFLFFIVSFVSTYSSDTELSDDLILAAAILTHFGACVKPPLYLLYRKNRHLIRKTQPFASVCRRQTTTEPSQPTVTKSNSMGELTTEL